MQDSSNSLWRENETRETRRLLRNLKKKNSIEIRGFMISVSMKTSSLCSCLVLLDHALCLTYCEQGFGFQLFRLRWCRELLAIPLTAEINLFQFPLIHTYIEDLFSFDSHIMSCLQICGKFISYYWCFISYNGCFTLLGNHLHNW